jgi:rubrerythrin
MNETQTNFDQTLLTNLRVDPTFDEPVLNQVLRIAMYDEYHAYESYKAVIEKFGNVPPFSNIIEAEVRHVAALEPLFAKYNVELPINDWVVETPNSLLEASELGVAEEIDNIKMYDALLPYVAQYPDVQDILYRLQAASYNNHLPAFRAYIANHTMEQIDLNAIYAQNSTHPNQADMMGKINEINALAGKFATGQVSQEDILKMLGNTNLSFLGGTLVGALGMMFVSQMKDESKEE